MRYKMTLYWLFKLRGCNFAKQAADGKQRN